MRKKALSILLFLLLVLGLVIFTFRVEAAKAIGPVWIHADGSVEPSSAPISTADRITYTLLDSMSGSIEIDRNNVVFDGAGNILQWTGTTDLGINLQGRTNVTIKNTIVAGFTTGIKLDSSTSCRLVGNTLTNNSYAIHLTKSSGNIISGNDASNNSDYGIWLSSSSGNSIYANTAKNNNYDGILLDGSFNNNIFENNLANNNDGIRLESSSGNTISTNSVVNSNGFDMWNTTNNGYAIVLVSSSQNIISQNTATNSLKDGIHLESSSGNSINGNNVANNKNGILLQSSPNNAISENYITKNTNFGIQLNSSSSNTISNNKATYDGLYGFYLEASTNNTILGNTVENNKGGLLLSSSKNNNVLGNNVTSNSDCGFKFESSSNENTISGNNITSNGYGVWFGSSTNNAVFQNNFVSNSVQVLTSGNKELWTDSSGTSGNYWSDYSAKYPNATQVGNSGVENAKYIIDSNNQDSFPLIEPKLSENTISEFPTWQITALLMIVTILPVVIYRQKHSSKK